MKKFFCILLFFLLFSLLGLCTQAAEYHYHSADSGVSAVQRNWDLLMENLPSTIQEELQGISFSNLQSTADSLAQKTDIRYWGSLILKYIRNFMTDMPSKIAPIFSIMILTAAMQILLPAIADTGLRKTVYTYSGLLMTLLLYRQTYDILRITQTSLDRLCKIMNLMTPVMETVYLSAGSLTQRAVSTQATALFVTLSGNFNGYLLTPLTNLLFTLSAVASVCDEVKLTPLIGSLRKLILRMIQIFTMFFSFMLGSQTILAKSTDTLGMKTAKFFLGSFIPVAGGTLAETLATLREGMALVKSAAGIGGILVIILLVLPDILQLTIYKFSLYLAATGGELLKLDKFPTLSHEIHGIIELLTAIVIFTAMLFVLLLILFTKAQVSI